MVVATTEPKKFVRGESQSWTRTFADYDPTIWSLNYHFVNEVDLVTVTTTDNGNGAFLAVLTPTDSVKFGTGTYHWQAVATKTDEEKVVATGVCEIVGSFKDARAGFDTRSTAERILAKIETLLLETAGNGETAFAVDGTSFTFESKAELIVARDRFKREVNAEKRAEKLRNGFRDDIQVRF